MTENDLIASAYSMSAQLLHRMVDDLTSDEFLRQPCPGANNAAWVIGHLTNTLRNSLRRLGAIDLPELPAGLAGRFVATKQVAGEQTELGDPKEMLKLFDEFVGRLIVLIRALPADRLTTVPEVRGPFATNFGEALQFGALHIAMHTGQLSTIRRSLGKPPIV
jgi:DinB superfamily